MVSWYKSGVGTEEYGYLADNKRVWKKTPASVETIYFYGAGGQKLVTYTVTATSPLALSVQSVNVYFGGKVIRADGAPVVHDRLGSVVWRSGVGGKDYFPYGDEIGSSSSGNVDKFGTYLRDQTTGLDYADQRYFAGTMGGRFLSSDPYEASGGASEPGSWNRYPYVGGDPVNFGDRQGLEQDPADFSIDVFDVSLDIPIGYRDDMVRARRNAIEEQKRLRELTPSGSQDQHEFDARRQTAHFRIAASSAINSLSKECIKELDNIQTTNSMSSASLLQSTISAAGSANFVTSSGYSAELTISNSYVAGSSAGNIQTGTTVGELALAASLKYPTNAAFVIGNAVIIQSLVFYSQEPGAQATTLVHELLHVATRLDDIALASKLKLGTFTDIGAASQEIQKFLSDNCARGAKP